MERNHGMSEVFHNYFQNEDFMIVERGRESRRKREKERERGRRGERKEA